MGDLRAFHEGHGAVFEERAGRELVRRYRKPDRTHRAVRQGVGVTEVPRGVIVVEGSDRLEYVDNVVTNRVPPTEGRGCYALLLDPQGRVEADLYVFNGGDRLLVFTAPGQASDIVAGWEVFIQDVELRVASEEFAVFGVHGPTATEKVASVLTGATPPEERLSFVRGSMNDVGVTVVRTDAPAGEVGYEVICAEGAADVVDTLVNRGMNAVPFGLHTWESLTLEAGTPLFETELGGHIPNMAGVRNAVDFEKGCFVGQEVVSRIENRGRPNERLVGLLPEDLPEPGAAVFDGDTSVGEVTRALESPVREEPIAFAYVDFDVSGEDLTVRVSGEEVAARVETLPFVEGSERSARLPHYEE